MSLQPSSNIILIGMPAVGKSTVGVLLAKATGRHFIDTDVYIQAGTGRTLQEIINTDGLAAFRTIEQQYLMCLEVAASVIATGGSAVYSSQAMNALKRTGPAVFIDLPLETIRARLNDMHTRGLAKPPEMTLDDLYAERRPLYQRYADLTIDADGLNQDQLTTAIIDRLSG